MPTDHRFHKLELDSPRRTRQSLIPCRFVRVSRYVRNEELSTIQLNPRCYLMDQKLHTTLLEPQSHLRHANRQRRGQSHHSTKSLWQAREYLPSCPCLSTSDQSGPAARSLRGWR